MDRREVLKKAGVGAAIVWAAPVVEAVVAPSQAAAASASGCVCTAITATHIGYMTSVTTVDGEPYARFRVTAQAVGCTENIFFTGLPGSQPNLQIGAGNATGFNMTHSSYPFSAPATFGQGSGATPCGTTTFALDPSIVVPPVT